MNKVVGLVALVSGSAALVLAAAYAVYTWWSFYGMASSIVYPAYGSYYGMMHGVMMDQCPCLGYGGQTYQSNQRLTIQQAVGVLERYVRGLGEDLQLKEVMEFQYNFYAVVLEKNTGRGAFELIVNPYTGQVSPEPGPNMMWNVKYGMHARMMGWTWQASPGMPVSPEQAEEIASRYLMARFGEVVEVKHPTVFYGYYTFDYKLNGRTHGMLSVNGLTGEVWYHSWHGQFVQEIEMGE